MSVPNAIPPQHILVVDDEESVLEAIKMLLTFDGHTVETAANGAEALRKLVPGQFSLLITDFCMPEMDGGKVALAAKRRSPELPVIMLTAFPPQTTPEGIDLLLTKPFLLEHLRHALTTVLGGVGQATEDRGRRVAGGG